MKRFILTVLVAAISTSGVAAPRHVVKVHASAGGSEDSLGNLKRWMPKAFQNWQDNVPDDLYGESTKWLTEFDGTVTPIRAVLIGGEKRFIGTVCKPGWCVNHAEVLIAPGRIAGIAHLEKMNGAQSVVIIGTFKGDETTCLEKLKDEPNATSC